MATVDVDGSSKQGVALTKHNRTGPPCSVGRPIAHAPGSLTDDDRRQRAKQYWPIRWASNNSKLKV